MAVDRRSDIHRNGCGDAADSGIPGVFGCLLLFLKRAAEDQVHGSLRVGGCMNDEPVILFQRGDPVLDVGSGVAVGVLVGDAYDSAKKGRAHLGYQFLFAVKLISEAVAKDAMQTALVAGAVYQLVKERAVIVRRIDEAGTRGHVDGIGRGPVVSAVLAGAVEIECGAILPSGNDAFAEFVFADLRRDGGLRDFRKREAVALLHVENRVVAKNEGNTLILARCFLVFRGVLGKLLVKDYRRTVLAFADTAFQCLRLLEGKPERRAVFARPKQKDVDAPVGLAGIEVARERAASIARRLPWLFPRNHARFEAGNNAVGNGLVDAWPAGCVTVVAICHDVSLSCAARVVRNLKEGFLPLALNQISFVECPRFMSCASGGGEAGSVKGACLLRVHGASANTLDGFRPALP